MKAATDQTGTPANPPEPLSGVLSRWAAINSGSYHEAGLNAMLSALREDFAALPGQHEVIPCTGEPGEGGETGGSRAFPRFALRIRRMGSEARQTILLNGHYDTVYGPQHPFQKVDPPEGGWMRGPGVTDMKGGLLVLLEALKRWEAGPLRERLSWEVLLTPDEEIGSPFSIPLLQEAAASCDWGLIYESAYPDGGFVRTRKGSATYRLQATGRAAHVGRNFHQGVNAITALCRMTGAVEAAAEKLGIIANIGSFEGGGPLNVVPDRAELFINVRAAEPDAFAAFERELDQLIDSQAGPSPAARFRWSGGITRPPKIVDAPTQALYDRVSACASACQQPVSWRDTGGGSDGSNLAAYGLPNIDNLGVCGSGIHSSEETVELASIEARIALSLSLLTSLSQS
jgi:glutamate carboxypeptidase